MGKDKNFVFSCVVHSRFKAFGKKQENRTHRKISRSAVSIIIIILHTFSVIGY